MTEANDEIRGREWVVTYKPGRVVIVWAVIVDVPRELGRDDVVACLESWHRWPQWQARVRPGAVLAVRPRSARDADKIGGQRVHRIEWAELAPARKKLQVEVDGPTYASIVRAARLSGQTLQRWAVAHLAAAAGVEFDQVDDEQPPPAFVDVPLPLAVS